MTTHNLQSQLSVFLWFGVGLGLPLLALSFFSGAGQRWVTRQSAVHARLISIAGGLLLISIAIYNFWINWQTISLLFT